VCVRGRTGVARALPLVHISRQLQCSWGAGVGVGRVTGVWGGGAPVLFSAASASLAGLKSSSAPNLKKAASSSLPNICTSARLHADYSHQ
jgi:hypothetical protein